MVGADGVVRPIFVLASTDLDSAHPVTVVTGVMEFDAPQRDVTHIHTIYRDPTNDYGAKLVK